MPTEKRKSVGASNAASSKPAARERAPDGRRPVGRAPMPGPEHRRAGRAERGEAGDRRVDVGVGDVAEDAAREHELGGYGAGVDLAVVPRRPRRSRSRRARRAARGRARGGGVARVALDEPRGDVAPARMAREHAEQVAALARAEAHRAERAGRRAVEPRRGSASARARGARRGRSRAGRSRGARPTSRAGLRPRRSRGRRIDAEELRDRAVPLRRRLEVRRVPGARDQDDARARDLRRARADRVGREERVLRADDEEHGIASAASAASGTLVPKSAGATFAMSGSPKPPSVW